MASSWWSQETVAVVTGANRGIGLEIVRQLADKGLTVVLTARDSAKGQAAMAGLHAKGLKNVVFHQLDVSSPESVQRLSSWLKIEYGWIDILINNAAAAPEDFTYKTAKYMMGINHFGVTNVTESLLLLMRPSAAGARIVMVTSRSGLYERLKSESIKKLFRDESKYSKEYADQLVAKFLEDKKAGGAEHKDSSWLPDGRDQIYGESKMFLNVYTIGLAKALSSTQAEGREVFIAGMCPGATDTDMQRLGKDEERELPAGFTLKSVEDGADTAVWLALLPRDEWNGKSGKLFAERTEYAFSWNPPF